MNLRFLPQEEIDPKLWNSCVHFASNGSIYGYDWFLNNTAREWDAIVEDDNYTAVLPLPRQKNWYGKISLTQPKLIPELALYSNNVLSPRRVAAFWEAVPEYFRSGSLTLEPASIPEAATRFDLAAATGSPLFLNRPHEEIVGDFPPAYFRQLALAEDAELLPISSVKPEKLATFWQSVHGKGGDNEWKFHAMQRLMYQTLHRGWGNTFTVQTPDKRIIAAAFITYSHGRMFPIFSAESQEGADAGAMVYLFSNLLISNAERPLKIRREDIPFATD